MICHICGDPAVDTCDHCAKGLCIRHRRRMYMGISYVTVCRQPCERSDKRR